MANHPMDPRRLAALVSSLVAELLLSLPHHPTTAAATTTTTTTTTTTITTSLITLLCLLNTSTTATSLSLLHHPPPKRRKLSSSSSSPPPPPSLDPFHPFFRMSAASFEWLCGLLDPLLDCRDPVGSPSSSPPTSASPSLSSASPPPPPTPPSPPASASPSPPPASAPSTSAASSAPISDSGSPSPPPLPTSTQSPPNSNPSPDSPIAIASRNHDIVVSHIVVDNSCRILSIVAGFRGGIDKGDSRGVLESSALYKDVEEGKVLNGPVIRVGDIDVPQYLVGDEGYTLLPWLIVPFVHPAPSSGEEEFNVAIRKMRLPAVRTIRSLRNWGVLSKPIEEEDVKMAVACVGACSILHNALLMREDYSALSDEIEDDSFHDQMSLDFPNDGVDNEAAAIRRALLVHTREVRDSN
ncbi:hypothetical protein Scep_001500 [Stephania cephalantha]|uniref:DDE Tnp4 domain-containing protein n=1 Tax=Stephania cephalantha TaxID=152367 RepID=A0AAP0LBV8_9MAGN